MYLTDGTDPPVFRPVAAPGAAELQALVQNIAERIGRLLEQRGLSERDAENAWLGGDPAQAGSLDDLIGHSITYRIAVGPRAGQKVFTLQTVPAQAEAEGRSAAQAGGFSLHGGLDIQPGQRGKGGKVAEAGADPPAVPRHVAMSGAQRLKRVFGIEIEACARCSGRLKVIASIEDPAVIAHILAYLARTSGTPEPELAPLAARAPPVQSALL